MADLIPGEVAHPVARVTVDIYDLSPREIAKLDPDKVAMAISGMICDEFGAGCTGNAVIARLRPLTELEDDAYGVGGPKSGHSKPHFVEVPVSRQECDCHG